MLDHILIPLDGSFLAADAIEPATQILKAGGKFTLVTVVDIPTNWQFGNAPAIIMQQSENSTERLLSRAKVYLEDIAMNLRADDFQVDTVAQYGDAATVIVENARTRKVDAIAMSTHGRSGFSRLLFGSVTSKVLSAAPCPVFVIPSEHQQTQMNEPAHEINHH